MHEAFFARYFVCNLVGSGVALLAIVGVVFFGDNINATKVISFGLLIVGVVGLNLSGISH
jgi:multidrug transporter EmrE-like cation transporter